MGERLMLAAILYGPAATLAVGSGITAVLAIPALVVRAEILLPHAMAEGLVIGAALAWHVAPRLLSISSRRE